MADARHDDITELLGRARDGDREAGNAAFIALLDELRRIARRLLRRAPGVSLEEDDLIGGGTLKFASAAPMAWSDRGHFLAGMSRAMRQYLIDHLRGKLRQKRDAPGERERLTGILVPFEGINVDLIDLHEALRRLAEEDAQEATIIELTHFHRCTAAEVSELLAISVRTVERDLQMARTTLRRWLRG